MLTLIYPVQHHPKIMQDPDGRPICSLRFADDIGFVSDLQGLFNRLVDRVMAYGIEVSTEKSKIMINGTNNISADISMIG